jgi:hypothetical protein
LEIENINTDDKRFRIDRGKNKSINNERLKQYEENELIGMQN